jgi:hypothetical protein
MMGVTAVQATHDRWVLDLTLGHVGGDSQEVELRHIVFYGRSCASDAVIVGIGTVQSVVNGAGMTGAYIDLWDGGKLRDAVRTALAGPDGKIRVEWSGCESSTSPHAGSSKVAIAVAVGILAGCAAVAAIGSIVWHRRRGQAAGRGGAESAFSRIDA